MAALNRADALAVAALNALDALENRAGSQESEPERPALSKFILKQESEFKLTAKASRAL